MKTIKYTTLIALLVLMAIDALGQKKKIWISGAARGVMHGDSYSATNETDTLTARNLQTGHALVDLGVNIQPSDAILIKGMVRIRNDYGGFWGSGVSFDVRQLYIKGIIGGFLRYQLGDIDYKLTPYTFNNTKGLINQFDGVITGVPKEQIQYDLFYMENPTWRQQGAALDFALEFSKLVEEMQFNMFTTVIRPSNFTTQDDRLYSGGSVVLLQSKFLRLGGQYANLYDFQETSNNNIFLRNPVLTGSAEVNYKLKKTDLSVAVETGRSTLEWLNDEDAPVLEDYFYDASVKAAWASSGLSLTAGYRNVGPNFRSAGAQTMQINFAATPQAYQRYGNSQSLRQLTMLDLYRDASLYNVQIQEGLMPYDPRYNNATPYGRATPNRKGFNLVANYEDLKERWMVEATTELISDVVGEGTEGLRNYNTTSIFAELRVNKLIGLTDRKIWISGRLGSQNTRRDVVDIPEDQVDLATQFTDLNLTATIFGKLEFIGQYRLWSTTGNELLAVRNNYSEIINYAQYTMDYRENLLGAGIQYEFSEKTHLRFMWQTFKWQDERYIPATPGIDAAGTLPYSIDTWTLFFTMNF